ncbi:uncharacterized protein LOC112345443 isoform X1 [Selaginella moellendorffii]|uniref:uncharacterized protein LOC112345443 isoform X1 n=1 Tax=Selaginella moellendorffii TaxID=88036 RepID=UPI000D1CA012|nr:uncharacterized protein LOC112345443 isoform X1 [Selaginella moellendorffii]|eukprot:XP_024527959.1 uncharacterized protein LOC112345443 isoform X1 [Selaginella moellendorffii]
MMLGGACVAPSVIPLGLPSRARLVRRPRFVRCSTNGSLHSFPPPSSQLVAAQDFRTRILDRFRGLLCFFKEQFSEFGKIEWPSFDNTVKTSLFVIALSFVLIIALTAMDSGYTFVLSKML